MIALATEPAKQPYDKSDNENDYPCAGPKSNFENSFNRFAGSKRY